MWLSERGDCSDYIMATIAYQQYHVGCGMGCVCVGVCLSVSVLAGWMCVFVSVCVWVMCEDDDTLFRI